MLTPLLALAVFVLQTACSGDKLLAREDGSTPPPGPPIAAPVSAECARSAPEWIWCDDFEENRLGDYFEFSDGGGRFARTAGSGMDSSWGMRARFDNGTIDAGSLKLAFGRTPQSYFRSVSGTSLNHRDLHFRLFLRLEPGWQGGGGEKLARMTMFVAPGSWAQGMIAHLWSGGPNEHHLVLDPASGTDASGSIRTTTYNDFPNLRWLGAHHSPLPLFAPDRTGGWECVEARVRLNDPGSANGRFELWLNGVEQLSLTDLNWVGGYQAYGLNALFLENFWNDGAPATQYRSFDRLVVSTARIGC